MSTGVFNEKSDKPMALLLDSESVKGKMCILITHMSTPIIINLIIPALINRGATALNGHIKTRRLFGKIHIRKSLMQSRFWG